MQPSKKAAEQFGAAAPIHHAMEPALQEAKNKAQWTVQAHQI